LRELPAFEIEEAKIVGGRHMAELGGGCEQSRGLFTILGAAAPAHAEHCEREHRFAIAALGSDL